MEELTEKGNEEVTFSFLSSGGPLCSASNASLMVKPIILLEPELELFSSKYFIGAGAGAF